MCFIVVIATTYACAVKKQRRRRRRRKSASGKLAESQKDSLDELLTAQNQTNNNNNGPGLTAELVSHKHQQPKSPQGFSESAVVLSRKDLSENESTDVRRFKSGSKIKSLFVTGKRIKVKATN